MGRLTSANYAAPQAEDVRHLRPQQTRRDQTPENEKGARTKYS